MLNKLQAERYSIFYFLDKNNNRVLKCRKTGKLQTWKTRKEQWYVPVKYGLYCSAYIGYAPNSKKICEDPERFYVSEEEARKDLPPVIKGRIGTKKQRRELEDLYLC